MTNFLIGPKSTAAKASKPVCPIYGVSSKALKKFTESLSADKRNWLKTVAFKASAGEVALLPNGEGGCDGVLLGLGDDKLDQTRVRFLAGVLASKLPEGLYRLDNGFDDKPMAALAFALGCYRFDDYKKITPPKAKLIVPDGADLADLKRIVQSITLTRDLINKPANDLGPAELEAAIRKIGRKYKARTITIKGAKLAKDFPMIQAVGQASDRLPRLIDLRWGNARHPKLTLVGKGVCFDTGGLNLKPGSSMALMKKDMGGAANVLGLAAMIMDAKLPVKLRLLIPAVDNNLSGNAFRPGDVLKSRKGLSVEIGNTDAEGRLVLADALALADEEKPDLLIDMATLTGAARVALGPDLPPFYCDDDAMAAELVKLGTQTCDPLWRMPFWAPYDNWLSSKIADVNHISNGGFAGSITAALFLKRFVENAKTYLHFDIMGWTPKALPGRPEGGEAQAIRALYALLKKRYSL